MLTEIVFQPGIVLDETESRSENRYTSGNNVRFVNGKAQTIGGWEAAVQGTFASPARGAHAWATLTKDRVIAFGTSTALYQLFGGALTDITPLKAKGTLTDPFEMTNGSAVVKVTHADHGLKDGDTITYSNADAVGGITVDGDYEVTVLTLDRYTITHASNATSDATGGGSIEYSAPLDTGLVDGVGGSGFGTGTYGTGAYGLPTIGDYDPRRWSIGNFGAKMLAVPAGGALYAWQPQAAYDTILENGDFAAADGWTAGTGWSIGSGVATATAGTESQLSQDVTGIMNGGLVYVVEFTLTVTAGSLTFEVENGTTTTAFGAAITKAGTYSRRFTAPSLPTDIHFKKDASFAGTLDDVSISVEDEAYRIAQAPQYSTGMFVDPNNFVVLFGTVEADGDYNALLVRWCDRENDTVWIPDTDNLAGEIVLGEGSRVVAGIPSRGQNLILTDEAAFTMRYTRGGADVFSFDLVGSGCGAIGLHAVAEHQGNVFWWGRNGQFYIFRGGLPQIIECPCRETVIANLAPSQEEKIFCGVNSEYNEVWWFYPDARDGNECSRYIAYNWVRDTWFIGELSRSSWIASGQYRNPIGFAADEVDGGGGPANKVYFHERGNSANGADIPFHLETGSFNVGDGDRLFNIKGYVPDFGRQVGNINVTLTFSQWPRGDQVNQYTGTVTPTTKVLRLRKMGRECVIRWENGTNFRYAKWGDQRLDVEPSSAKR